VPAQQRRPKPRTVAVEAPAAPVEVVPARPAAEHSHDTAHVDVSPGRQSAGHSRSRPKAAWGGTSMTAASSHELEGPRPPLGVLLLDLGGTFVLDGDIVIGREPEVDHDVTSGLAHPLILDEPAQRVSRRHARITVIDWDVFVMDLGSTNGTRLQRPDESPMRIPAQALIPITPGTIIWLADRWIRYESNRDPQGPADDQG
jgi:hypothetical protein